MFSINRTTQIRRIMPSGDIAKIANSIIGSEWGKDNEMYDFDLQATRQFVASPDNILLIAYVGKKPAGVCLASKNYAPYKGNKSWLYIDEVDVHPDFRRQGIAAKMMKKLFEIGREMDLNEAWVGTEPDNAAANALYRSLSPSETEDFVGYTYKLKN